MQIISNIISEVFDITPEDAVDAAYLKIDKWDSLGHVSLIIALEKAFNVEINGEQVLELISYEKIVDFYKNLNSTGSVVISKNNNPKKSTKPEIQRGLNNIYFDETEIGFIDQANSALYYRGYPISSLINSNFALEEVMYLVLFGCFPDNQELENFCKKLQKGRTIVFENERLFIKNKFLPSKEYLQASIPIVSQFVQNEIEYISILPTLIFLYNKASVDFLFSSQEILDTKSHAEFVLKCLQPEKKHLQEEYEVFEKQMIIHMEHGSNASTFACRTTCSTNASFADALLSAISTFSGALHGGAMENVSLMLDEFLDTTDLETTLEKRVLNAKPIYGFGHRVYKNNDPRAMVLRKLMEKLIQCKGEADFVVVANRVVKKLETYSQKGLGINVDFYSALILKILELKLSMFLPSFVFSRIVGWLAHYREQTNNNILIRPRLYYKGDVVHE